MSRSSRLLLGLVMASSAIHNIRQYAEIRSLRAKSAAVDSETVKGSMMTPDGTATVRPFDLFKEIGPLTVYKSTQGETYVCGGTDSNQEFGKSLHEQPMDIFFFLTNTQGERVASLRFER